LRYQKRSWFYPGTAFRDVQAQRGVRVSHLVRALSQNASA